MALARAADRLVCVFKPQNLANMAWAYATLGHKSLRLVHKLAEEVIQRGAQELQNDPRVRSQLLMSAEKFDGEMGLPQLAYALHARAKPTK